jgi:hypothetical protein
MANAQQETQVATWLRSGYSRLDDRHLTRHLELEVDALNKTDVGTCAAFGRSSIAGTPIDSATSNKIVGALDQASMVEFLGMNVEAIEAELRGSPTPIHVTSAQTSASFQQMIGGLSQAELLTLGNLSSGQTASDTDTCNAIRGLYREALQLDPASKAVVARFDIDPS